MKCVWSKEAGVQPSQKADKAPKVSDDVVKDMLMIRLQNRPAFTCPATAKA